MKLPRSQHEVRFAEAQGRLIYEIRIANGLSRRALAESSGVSCQAIFRIEMGEATASTYDIAMLARALGVKVEELCPDPNSVLPKLSASVLMMMSLSARHRPRVFA